MRSPAAIFSHTRRISGRRIECVLVCGKKNNPVGKWVSLVGRDSRRAAVRTKSAVLAREYARPTNRTPLCHHCLATHDLSAQFCPECGTAVGACTNLLPFPYLFSIGHTLRIGTNERFKRSPLTIAGFVLFGFAEYGPLAPFYWFRLMKNLRTPNFSVPPDTPGPRPGDTPGERSGSSG